MPALAFPVSLTMFFYEMNVLRNVSLLRVFRFFLVGGVTAIIFSHVLFNLFPGLSRSLGHMAAGPIEEVGKAAALLTIVNVARFRWQLNGMLFGAAIGAGFAAFETAGYAFESLYSFDWLLTLRGVLTLLGSHVAWTAIVAAAIWRAKEEAKLYPWTLLQSRFWRVAIFAVVLHMLWNAPIQDPFYLNQLVAGCISWILVLSLIQEGLDQVADAQKRERENLRLQRAAERKASPVTAGASHATATATATA